MTQDPIAIKELERICRVSNMLCSAHSALRDRYGRWALWLDVLILAASTWLASLAFAADATAAKLTPFSWDPRIWTGTLGTAVFFLSIIQIKTEWKGKCDAHKRTADIYGEVRREAELLLKSGVSDLTICERVFSKHQMASAVGLPLAEAEFLDQKKRHLMKVAISRHLDAYPAANVFILKFRFWWRDNAVSSRETL